MSNQIDATRNRSFQSRVKQFHRKVDKAKRINAFLLRNNQCLRNSSNSREIENSKDQIDHRSEIDARSSSEQEHKVNALASGADEGRDKLR